jgi:hypothetical protein
MSEQNTAIEKRPVQTGERGIELRDLDAMWRWSNYVAASGLAPKGIEKPESIVVAIQMGLELGLSPMAALQNIAVINGRPTVWGDAQLAIVRGTGELEKFNEYYEENGTRLLRNPSTFTDTTTAVCYVKRAGCEPQESSFSVADAKKASLWGKQGPWSQYPARMLRFRARSFALRDNFGDALRGIRATEEVMDMADVISVETVEPKPTGPKFRKPEAAPTNPVDQPAPTAPVDSPAPVDAFAGHAHVVTQPEPTTEPAQLPLQDQLAAHVTNCGGTFDDFVTLCRNQNWVKPEVLDNWTGFADMPDALAKKFLGAKRGVENGIKAILETKAQA